ncbi:hypothetical protein C4D60_Mb00t15300 [Musa balbisiana]|uniref:Uncharacterized protein n=1 Tax=Musa balbisiana TaxID=52838 RepID=A0A4S8I2M1_MUSBA|nr:hypothetical protein C4D60_Mb00t15300 [Musa balbisiana]
MAVMTPESIDGGRRVDSTTRLPALTSQVAPLPSFQRDVPSMKQHQSRSRSRSQPPALISSEPRPWTSLFKAPIGSLDLSLEFFALEVQAEKKIAVYEIVDSAKLIETWSMVNVGYVTWVDGAPRRGRLVLGGHPEMDESHYGSLSRTEKLELGRSSERLEDFGLIFVG